MIVIGDRDFGLSAPQLRGAGLRGTMPSGQTWAEAQLTPAETRDLEARGAEVIDNAPVSIPDDEKPQVEAPGVRPFNAFARDIHGADTLALRGPEWEGEGGLFISIDTGVAPHHDLSLPERYANTTKPNAETVARDGNGHGTHTWGSALAHGDPSNGGTRGMAPRAHGMAIAALGDNGKGTTAGVLKAIELAVEWGKDWDGPVVVGISIGSKAGDPSHDALVRAIDDASKRYGILFSISAGNEGRKGDGTISSPGTAPYALTSGAMDHHGTLDTKDDNVAVFSSRDVPAGVKPDLTARGVQVRSTYLNDGYAYLSGTSMAQPVTGGGALSVLSGLWAEYIRGEISVNPRDLVRNLEFQRTAAATAQPLPGVPHNVQGAGDLRLVPLADALTAKYKSTPTRRPAPYFPGVSLQYTPPF